MASGDTRRSMFSYFFKSNLIAAFVQRDWHFGSYVHTKLSSHWFRQKKLSYRIRTLLINMLLGLLRFVLTNSDFLRPIRLDLNSILCFNIQFVKELSGDVYSSSCVDNLFFVVNVPDMRFRAVLLTTFSPKRHLAIHPSKKSCFWQSKYGFENSFGNALYFQTLFLAITGSSNLLKKPFF